MFKKHKCFPELELFNLDKGPCSLLIAVADIYADMHHFQCHDAGILTVSVLPSLCACFNMLQALGFFSASRAEPCLFHTLTS